MTRSGRAKSTSRLAAARVKLGWSQERLAQESSIAVRTIYIIERGKVKPQQDTKRRLTLALGLLWSRHREIFE